MELPALAGAGENAGLEQIEADFFNRLKLRNGTYKTTGRYRLDDVNALFFSLVASGKDVPLEILDVATSSGVAALRWFDSLRAQGMTARMTMSDLTMFAYLVTPLGWFTALVDRSNVPLEFEIFERVVRGRVKKADLLTARCIPILCARAFFRLFVARRSLRSRLVAGSGTEMSGGGSVIKLPLVASAVRRREDISLIEDDILAENPKNLLGRFDAIRAANILQPVYFDQRTIRRAVTTLKKRLKGEGSRLIICRTDDEGRNNATIFCIRSGLFVVEARVGNGSEIEQLVLDTH